MALFLHDTVLRRRGGKERIDGGQQSEILIGDDQIYRVAPTAPILEQATPSVFVFLGTHLHG